MKIYATFPLLCFAMVACTQNGGGTLRAPSLPSSLPADDYILNEWVDDRGCRFVRLTNPSGIQWAPKVNTDGQHMCDGPTKLSAAAKPAIEAAPVAPAPRTPAVEVLPQDEGTGFITPAPGSPLAETPPVILPRTNQTPAKETPEDVAPSPAPQETAPIAQPVASDVSSWAQIGSFSVPSNAENLLAKMRAQGFEARSVGGGKIIAVQVRKRAGISDAALLSELRQLGFNDAFILR